MACRTRINKHTLMAWCVMVTVVTVVAIGYDRVPSPRPDPIVSRFRLYADMWNCEQQNMTDVIVRIISTIEKVEKVGKMGYLFALCELQGEV